MRPSFALPLILLSSTALADALQRDRALKLDDMLISANREVQARSDSSTASTVFTRDDIDRLQPTSVTDLLRRVPGVQVSPTGGRGSLPGISIRGTKAAQSLVLVDGQRIANATSADSNLQYLNIDQIERVEVLRGSRSVIYGADAIGGVIQIFTRRGSENGLQPRMRLAMGSNQTFQRSLGLSGGDAQTRFNLGASLDETAGLNRTTTSFDADNDHDAYRNKSLNLNLSHRFDDNLQAGFNLLDNRGKSEYDNPFGRYDFAQGTSVGQRPFSDFNLSSIGGYLDARLADNWNSRLELGHSENREQSGDTLSDDASAFNTYRDSLNWQNTFDLNEQHSVLAGAEWYEDRVHASTEFDADSRWNRALFVQHRYKGEDFSTELGVRHDSNQQFGSQNTWSASLTLPINASNDMLFSYSEGFRAPTFNDLYYPDFSNPNLKPEHSRSYEVQWRSQLSETRRIEASLYRTDLKDAITLDSNYRPQNTASARINGFEAAWRDELFGWQSNLGISLIDPRDRDTGHTLNRRARRTLSLDLDRQFGQLGLGASWQAVSSSFNDEANNQHIGGYGLLGLRGSWAFNTELKMDLTLDNVLDKSWSRTLYSYNGSAYGYREEGQAWRLGLTWTPAL